MGIEINFIGCLPLPRIEEFSASLDTLTRSMGGETKRSQFRLPEDVMSYVRENDGVLSNPSQPYLRSACGELIVVWEVMAPNFAMPFAICWNMDWKGALVLYETKNWGSAYPLVSHERRLRHDRLDPTICEIPVCIRRSHELQGHLDAEKILDLIKEQLVPDLWGHDDTGYYKTRESASIKNATNLINSFVSTIKQQSNSPPTTRRK